MHKKKLSPRHYKPRHAASANNAPLPSVIYRSIEYSQYAGRFSPLAPALLHGRHVQLRRDDITSGLSMAGFGLRYVDTEDAALHRMGEIFWHAHAAMHIL